MAQNIFLIIHRIFCQNAWNCFWNADFFGNVSGNLLLIILNMKIKKQNKKSTNKINLNNKKKPNIKKIEYE